MPDLEGSSSARIVKWKVFDEKLEELQDHFLWHQAYF